MSKPTSLHVTAKLITALVVLTLVPGCDRDSPEFPSFEGGCILDTSSVDPCDDCLRLDHAARLGTVDGPGYLTARGGIEAVVRDLHGNYWVGQGEQINVYQPDGEFLETVGREGEGPLEFQYARPVHVDARGRVHIYDISNLRLSVVDAGLALVDERRLPSAPSINSIAPLGDGSRYVIQAWIQTPEQVGLPLHLIDGPQILGSFGAMADGQHPGVASQASTRRNLATDTSDRIYAAHINDYIIEAWSPDGSAVGSLTGIPPLDDGRRTSARDAWSDENPPWNELVDLHVDAQGLLWVLLRHRRPDWRENTVEMAYPDGEIAIAPADLVPTNWFRSRIDVIDLEGCVRKAVTWSDEFLVGFVSDGFMAAGVITPAGVPFVDVFRTSMRN